MFQVRENEQAWGRTMEFNGGGFMAVVVLEGEIAERAWQERPIAYSAPNYYHRNTKYGMRPVP
jgi:hypothetical protein